jgi:hypothetical protein
MESLYVVPEEFESVEVSESRAIREKRETDEESTDLGM